MTARGLRSPVEALRTLTGDLRQLASVRRITLEDGAERGQRALAFSTGGGLDFWVLADRTMDIGPLWFRGTPVAWQHPNGFVAPDLYSAADDGGRAFERILSGFLVTCGLDHIRQPAGGRPLHGNLPLTPARLLAHGEDWDAAVPVLYAEGEATSASLDGPAFRLHRRITAPIGGRTLRIADRVENIGMGPQALDVLHHINFGFPAVGPGTRVSLNGEEVLQVGDGVADGASGPVPPQCLAAGAGAKTVAAIVRPPSPPWNGFAATVTSDADAQPFVQVWADRRPRRNIVAIEPATSDRRADGTSAPGPVLAPGERWRASLDIVFAEPDAAPSA